MKQTSTKIPELLRRLSRQTLDTAYLGAVNGSDIYQVQEGWQREILINDPAVTTVMSATEFEEAVRAPEISSIFVPHNAAVTQEVAERILNRNALLKTIYWEASQVK